MLLRSVRISPYHFPKGHKLDHPSANTMTVLFLYHQTIHFSRVHKIDHLSANATMAFRPHITIPFPKGTIKSTTHRQTKLLHSVCISPYHFPRYVNIDHPSVNATVVFRSNIPYHFRRESLPIHISFLQELMKCIKFIYLED